MKTSWQWVLLSSLSIAVILFYLYFEIALILKLYFLPQMQPSGKLTYHEPLGLFAPVWYLFEGAFKLLEGLSPIMRFIREVLLLINSILLVLSIPVSFFVFKQRLWAGVVIVLLSLPLMVFGFEELKTFFIW